MSEFLVPENNRLTGPIEAVAGQPTLTFDFPIVDRHHLLITRLRGGEVDVLLPGPHFYASGLCDENGGDILLAEPAEEGDLYVIAGATPKARQSDYAKRGQFRAEEVNRDLDLIIFMIQEMCAKLARASLVPIGEDVIEWPPATARQDCHYIVWKDGKPEMSSLPAPEAATATALEPILAHQLIHLFEDVGHPVARLARSDIPLFAHGFAAHAADAGEEVKIITHGDIPAQNVEIGKAYFLSKTPGRARIQIFEDGTPNQFIGWGKAKDVIATRIIPAAQDKIEVMLDGAPARLSFVTGEFNGKPVLLPELIQ